MEPANETPDGKPLPMKIEPWPYGRWYRDLGGDNGHFWGHVQAIKKPTLLEICGPFSGARVHTASRRERGGAWKLMNENREVMTIPRVAVLRSIMLNHWYHHRGQ